MSSIDRSLSSSLNQINDKRTARAVQQAFNKAVATASVTATGTSSQANSAPIEAAVNYITTSSASTKGVRLPTPQPGDPGLWLVNTNATYDVLVYPDVGGTINALSLNAAYTLPINQAAFFVPASGTQWYVGIVGATSAQIAYLTGSAAGIPAASKAWVLGATGDMAPAAATAGLALTWAAGASNASNNAGGLISLSGGAGNGSGAGGAVSLVGGAAGSTGTGGAVNLTGGTATAGAGGAVVIAGAAGVGSNKAGGLASVTGGASTGNATGGVASLVGGAGSAATGVGGAAIITGGAGNTTGAGGGVTITAGAGGNDAVGGVARLIGGAAGGGDRAGGAVVITAGAGAGTGAGGAVTITGGASTAGGATGDGGDIALVGGAAATTNANGGSISLTPGAKNGSGIAGGVFLRSATSQIWRQQVVSTAESAGNQVVAAADMINGICVHTVTTGATLTTPTGAQLLAVCPADIATGDSFDFTVITAGTGSDDISTLTAGDGDITFVGPVTVGGTTGHGGSGDVATWRFRYAGTNAFVGYRIA